MSEPTFNKLCYSLLNIAKIIETQYEINFVVPIIGEIVDKFIQEHLIYLFLKKKNGNFELKWPKECRDENISKLLKNLSFVPKFATGLGVFPLMYEEEMVGAIAVKSIENELAPQDINCLTQLSSQAAVTISRARTYSELLEHATLDSLTGFYNRGELEDRIKQETAIARRQNTPLCAIMVDIDFFKNINDTYGHAMGDHVLKTTASVIRAQLREYDIAGRYGGEEFAIILPATDINEARKAAERLRKAVEKRAINNIHVTISLGLYEFKAEDAEEDLIQNADKALYRAKEGGRNKVIIFSRD